MNKILVTSAFCLYILFFTGGCAVFSDGATVDYSRLFNFTPVFTVGMGGDMGGNNPWEADEGYKQARGLYGLEPWSTWSHDDVEFKNYKGRIETCNTIQDHTCCN